MLTDNELAGVVADNHRVTQKAMCLDAAHSAPSVAVCTGSGLTVSAAMPIKMRLPGGRIGKPLVGVLRKKGNALPGKRSRAHVRQASSLTR
jgi:hypothetical protein